METRPYFVFGDLISNLATGAFVGGLCTVIVTLIWKVSIAMVVGMAIGMVASLPAGILFGSLSSLPWIRSMVSLCLIMGAD